VAHPDDEVLGAGASMARFSEHEDVIVIIFSYGESWPPWTNKKELIEKRVKEARKASKVLGVKETFFLGLPDTHIREAWTNKHQEILHDLFVKYSPSRVFTHTRKDKHKDHLAVNEIINKEVKKYVKKTGKQVSVFCFEINYWSLFSNKEPQLVIDVSNHLIKKLEALRAFKSQWVFINVLRKLVLIKNIFYGKKHGYKYAEYFFSE